MNKYVLFVFVAGIIFMSALPASAVSVQKKFSGRILLQVEQKGEAWYINPLSGERVYLGRPSDAFKIMRELGLGIANKDLNKIAVSSQSAATNISFSNKFAGRILLQVEANGEAWYVNPIDLKRYYLGRPSDAFGIMRSLGLGISNADLREVPISKIYAYTKQSAQEKQSEAKKTQSPSTLDAGERDATAQTKEFAALAGSYRCWSYNVSGGGGGDCRLFAPIILKADGTYSVSSEQGTYMIDGDTLVLSESKIRGPGKINGANIRFEYDYNGWRHVLTYLKENGGKATSAAASSEIPVQLILEYPEKSSSLGGIVTVELVPEGENVKTALYKPTAIAQYDGDKRVIGSFYKATNTPRTGIKYTVYTNTGFASTAVGSLDLTNAKTETTATLHVSTQGTPEAKQTQVPQTTAKDIEVNLSLEYPAQDSSLGSINFVTLVEQGQDPTIAIYKPTATALWDGDRTITVSFWRALSRVRTNTIYTIYTDNGFGLTNVGTLDLTSIELDPYAKTISISQ